MGKLKVIRILFYTIGVMMAISYQAQGVWAAILAFFPVLGLFYLLNTERELAEKEEMIQLDTLTCVGNRYALAHWWKTRFPLLQRGSSRLCLLMIDLDDFKRINDSFGHQVGDRVLCEVTSVIAKSVRETDSIFRYGGEEFVVVLPGSDERVALEVAQRICSNLTRVQFAELGERKVTVSIGIAGLTEEMADEEHVSSELIRRSDIAMYLAKSKGKNQVCVYS